MAEAISNVGTGLYETVKNMPRTFGRTIGGKEGFHHKPLKAAGKTMLAFGTYGGSTTVESATDVAATNASNAVGEAERQEAEEIAELDAKNAKTKRDALTSARKASRDKARSTPGRPLLTSLNNSSNKTSLLA